jgi:hypothetical protein
LKHEGKARMPAQTRANQTSRATKAKPGYQRKNQTNRTANASAMAKTPTTLN